MKAVIYQYWEGKLSPGNEAGVKMMKEYADAIGVDHVFELNPSWPEEARIQRKNLGQYQPHFGAFKPLFDKAYDNYDYILFCDTDIIPITHSRERPRRNIFADFMGRRHEMTENNQYPVDIWISEEYMQPQIRTKHNIGGICNANDERWVKLIESTYQVKMPRTAGHLPKVFNSGVVMYSANARMQAQNNFVDFKKYVEMTKQNGLPSFYSCDQPYLHAMLEFCKFNWEIMPYIWNSQLHHTPGTRGQEPRPISDYRTEQTQFVHMQLNGADHYSYEETKRIAND